MIKYEVYMCHVLGWKEHLIGTYSTKEEAEKEARETEDAMYDCWVKEVSDVS